MSITPIRSSNPLSKAYNSLNSFSVAWYSGHNVVALFSRGGSEWSHRTATTNVVALHKNSS